MIDIASEIADLKLRVTALERDLLRDAMIRGQVARGETVLVRTPRKYTPPPAGPEWDFGNTFTYDERPLTGYRITIGSEKIR